MGTRLARRRADPDGSLELGTGTPKNWASMSTDPRIGICYSKKRRGAAKAATSAGKIDESRPPPHPPGGLAAHPAHPATYRPTTQRLLQRLAASLLSHSTCLLRRQQCSPPTPRSRARISKLCALQQAQGSAAGTRLPTRPRLDRPDADCRRGGPAVLHLAQVRLANRRPTFDYEPTRPPSMPLRHPDSKLWALCPHLGLC